MAVVQIERMAVETDGSGDAVVFIHGLGGTSNTWTPLMSAVSRHRAIRIDLPGSGRSHRVEGALSINRFVAAVEKACGVLGIERAHIVGHSLGTIVAMHLAVRTPKLVRSLALFGPLLAPPDVARNGLKARAAQAREQGMQPIADALVTASLARDTRERAPVAVAAMRESIMAQSPDGYARTCEALAAATPADVERIHCPTVLVTGEEDVVAPPASVRALADRIKGARVIVYPKCGHWTPFERPVECAQALTELLNQRTGATGGRYERAL